MERRPGSSREVLPFFFSTTGGIAIPPSLPSNFVDPESLEDPIRKFFFFSVLGVRECDPEDVLLSIEHRFADGGYNLEQDWSM